MGNLAQNLGARAYLSATNPDYSDYMNQQSDSPESARGGKVPAKVSEGEVVVPPKYANSPKRAASYVGNVLASGGSIKAKTPAQKATKPGNSYDNDKIDKELPEGAIVMPRSVTMSRNPERNTADFVAKCLAKQKGRR
jgi:hypothetical protein